MDKKQAKEIFNFLGQQRKREKQLLSEVLKAFESHKKRTLSDLEILKQNIKRSKSGK